MRWISLGRSIATASLAARCCVAAEELHVRNQKGATHTITTTTTTTRASAAVATAAQSAAPTNLPQSARASGATRGGSAVPAASPATTAPAAAMPPQAMPPASTPQANGEVLLTIAVPQIALANLANNPAALGIITLDPGNAVLLPTPAAAQPGPQPAASTMPGTAGIGPQAATSGDAPAPAPVVTRETRDPSTEGLLGGNPPNARVDLPLTIVFLILFMGGAATHISIYRANAKRGHKFLLSDLMFDFCMVRVLSCIFRIIWIFIHPRGVVLAAQIFFNGGAAVIFAVNIFLTQRIVRSMHPTIGWSRVFSLGTRAMAISVPMNIVLLISSLIGFFLSVGVESRLSAFEALIKFGVSYNLFLVTFPFIAIFLACSFPGPKPEKFGDGNLRIKTSMVMLSSAFLATGAIIRTYSFFNPKPPTTNDVLYSKPIFYTTQFMLEIIVVAGYALLRFDLLFHIPNGSSGPGDYSAAKQNDAEKGQFLARDEIEERIAACQIPHQILTVPYSQRTKATGNDQPVYAVFFPQNPAVSEALGDGQLPPRPNWRVSRRQSYMEAVRKSVGRQSRVGVGAPTMTSQARDPHNVPKRPLRDSKVFM